MPAYIVEVQDTGPTLAPGADAGIRAALEDAVRSSLTVACDVRPHTGDLLDEREILVTIEAFGVLLEVLRGLREMNMPHEALDGPTEKVVRAIRDKLRGAL